MMKKDDLILSGEALSALEEMVSVLLGNSVSKDRKFLSVEEWLASPYHSGELGRSMYPHWKTTLSELFKGNTLVYDELIVTGGIRTGKTWLCIGVWARMLYLLSLLEHPQDYLGLARTTQIIFAYLSITIQSAFNVGFGEITRILDSIDYFNSEFPRDKNKSTILVFPKNIAIICGSDFSKFISSAMISLFFDEGNFARVGGGALGDLDKAMQIYSNARTRVTNQFSTELHRCFNINMLVSSTTHEGSFTETLIKASIGIESTKIIQATAWLVKPKGTYSEEKFLFYSGTTLHEPRVIEKKEDLQPLVSEEHYNVILDGTEIEIFNSIPSQYALQFYLVPVNFLNDAKRLPRQFVRDTLGISLASTGRFFSDKPRWEQACIRGSQMGLQHPFTKEEISLSRKDSIEIKDYFLPDVMRRVCGVNPLYIHVDQSESGCSTGISISFPFRKEGESHASICVCGMLRINPPGEDDKISLVKIRQFITDLRDVFKFNLGGCSFDQYQSSTSIEILTSQGFPVTRLSVDTSDHSWFEVADCILTERLYMYPSRALEREWFELIHNRVKGKIEKPKDGTKDVADSFCGSVYSSLMSASTSPNVANQAVCLQTYVDRSKKGASELDLNKLLLAQEFSEIENSLPVISSNTMGSKWKKLK